MNKKYLFGMLVSGAMLAACTADDLNTAPVAQEVNPSAPVFTVTFEDEGLQNRAAYNSSTRTLDWKAGDKMSLFHGMSKGNGTNLDLTGWQNAIYQAAAGSADEGLTFTTHSMVQRGYAVMVWPADTGFVSVGDNGLGTVAPKVRIKQVQTREDRDSIPFISEIIEITENGKATGSSDAGTAGVAGYGNEYEIKMRRAAGTLVVALNNVNKPEITDPKVSPFVVKAVEIDMSEPLTPGANLTPFPLSLSLKKGAALAKATSTGWTKDHKTWKYSTVLDRQTTNSDMVGSIKTLDIDDQNWATFTVLPGMLDGTSNFAKAKGKVIVYTNWGNVTIGYDDEAYSSDYSKKLAEVLQSITDNLYADGGFKGSEFIGEPTGGFAGVQAKVDLKKLNMNGMHIQTKEELYTAIKVYNAIYADADDDDRDVELILDGDAKNGVFEMDNEVMALMAAEMEKTRDEEHGLTFKACTDAGEICSAVKITNTGAQLEIPSYLNFVNNVAVQLAGDWKYTSVTDITTANKTNEKDLTNVSGLTLVSGTLDLQNFIAVKASQLTEGITVNYGATANVNGKVELRVDMTNKGKVNIPASTGVANQLSVANNATLTNVSSQKGVGTNKANNSGLDTSECGVIENYGWLYCVKLPTETNAIKNYGIIYQRTASAVTLITENANSTSMKSNFATGSNEIGSIVLFSKDANNSLVNVDGANAQGFIKLTINSQDELEKNNAYGTKANYIILTGSCNKVRTGATTGTGAVNYTPTNIKYFEISKDLTGESVDFEDITVPASGSQKPGFSLTAIVVPEGKIVTVPDGTKVAISEEACVEGVVLESGEFDTSAATFNGYFNGPKSDAKNVGYVGNK